MPDDGEALHMWAGVSVFSSAERAQMIMQRFPGIGAFLVQLRRKPQLLEDGTIRIEKTGADPSHYTLWASPQELLLSVGLGQS